MDEEIKRILKYFMTNKRNSLDGVSKGIVKLINNKEDLVTINYASKQACFHGDFRNNARKILFLKPLVEYFEKEKYETNLNL